MKYMFASDIHGSAAQLEKLMKIFETSGARKLILMGDLLYHGPRNDLPEEYSTKRCMELYNAHRDDIICCRGNCDAEIDQTVLEFPIDATYNTLYLNGKRYFTTHGHQYSPENLPPTGVCDVFVSGHTHIPVAEKRGDLYLLNPGSASIPKGGYAASYGMLDDDNRFTIYDFEGNTIKAITIA